jgi:NAD(P)-dependent dehydrogenase (short-subunit alcohol dehydrogenase family)
MTIASERLLLFGASGAIGGAVLDAAIARGWQVTAVSRQKPSHAIEAAGWIEADPLDKNFTAAALATNGPYTSVCWAQGANLNDSVYDVNIEDHLAIYNANCTYILITLKALLAGKLLRHGSGSGARMCVISSIWQMLARQNKLSYGMSKAALQGLVLSASADLAKDGHLINAVLPGAMDTPMTRKNLSAEQIDRLSGATGFARLPQLGDVASLVCYLCSPENTGITGQFIAADLGYSRVRIV